jgi:hypothetical protein
LQAFPADNSEMTTDNTHALVGVLHERARAAATEPRQPDYQSRAFEAAFAQGPDDRAWARIRLAADLRADDQKQAALSVLDDAWLLCPSDEAERAIYTVAIAVHCDLGAYPTAVILEREQASRSVDGHFARAAARLYSELLEVTGEEEHRIRRSSYSGIADESEGGRSVIAA